MNFIGFDGTLLAPFLQFPELGTEFDVWGLTMEMDDRSTFEELKNHVLKFIEKYILESNGVRPFYMMGESFGSLLAIEVAHYIQTDLRHRPSRELLKGVVLINPATSYNKSQLAMLGPDIASLSSVIYPFGLLRLLPLFTDDYAVPQLFMMLQGKALPLIINDKTREAYMGRVAFSLIHKLKFMPRETLAWRLKEWLRIGCNSMSAKEEKFTSTFARLPFLIVVGEKDKTLPSLAEATRLAGTLI
jgi:pimeloyl-ACP methyl ester carboxylesterase